ncbi:peptidylprolyl isomerase [Ochrovirga pacifica]|uniref:peptidylprolyl isomerase n=1 Tax=Ochrovirga pacifica TaxID=1042376 RepID=UPI0002557F6E|nr:peptidylprolyl isomerase [Ochrovirga pacifica]
MKKFVVFFVCLCLLTACSLLKPKQPQVLFTLDAEPTYVSEFQELFQQDKATLVQTSFDENLDLMVNYKLKLKQARLEGLDTLESIQKELKTYKTDLATPYLIDEKVLDSLTKEAYDRSLWQVKASHILIATKATDTLKAWQKVQELKKQLTNGADFETLALEHSDDKSVVKNKGDLGYFSVFRMVYPFETAAYTTAVNSVSEPVKTSYGYHLIKVVNKRKSEGKVKVAHIMISGLGIEKQKRIDSVYQKLNNGIAFEQLAKTYSDDRRSKHQGGALKPFAKGELPVSFEEVAFSLSNNQAVSKPFTTPYGWHIVKYLGKEEIPVYQKVKKEFREKVLSGDRGALAKEAAFAKIERKHNVKFYPKAQEVFKSKYVLTYPKDSLQQVFLSIDHQNYLQEDYLNHIKYKRLKNLLSDVENFKNAKLKEFVIEHLEDESAAFRKTIDTYKKGLVIFELMKNHVWDVPKNETEKVKAYYLSHPQKYAQKGASFDEVKGYVESDYQEMIEKEWLQELKKNSHIIYNKRAIKKLRKTAE